MGLNNVNSSETYVLSTGAQTPVGRSSLTNAAAVRCGISAYAEHPFMVDKCGEPMVVAMANWLPAKSSLRERLAYLGLGAAKEAIGKFEAILKYCSLPIIFALPDEDHLELEAVSYLVNRVLHGVESGQVQPIVLRESNAVGVKALQVAREMLKTGHGYCLVLGVDSHISCDWLEALDRAGRLHSTQNSWGFTPGEGSGAVLLASEDAVREDRIDPIAKLRSAAVFEEKMVLGTQTVCIGEGLTQAFRAVLGEGKVSNTYCDLNGETYRAEEFGFAVCRTNSHFESADKFVAAATSWGDVGTASCTLQIALAAAAWNRCFADGDISLCWSSSATKPLRGAALLEKCSPN